MIPQVLRRTEVNPIFRIPIQSCKLISTSVSLPPSSVPGYTVLSCRIHLYQRSLTSHARHGSAPSGVPRNPPAWDGGLHGKGLWGASPSVLPQENVRGLRVGKFPTAADRTATSATFYYVRWGSTHAACRSLRRRCRGPHCHQKIVSNHHHQHRDLTLLTITITSHQFVAHLTRC